MADDLLLNTDLLSTDTTTSTITVTTDQADYAPETTATFTITDVTVGGSVDLSVSNVVDAGADGIIGTADDVLGTTLSGTGTTTVIDGGAGDLDGVANGVITTSWYVNDDAANQAFVLSATDSTTGAVATTNFTDSAPTPIDLSGSNSTNSTYSDPSSGAIFDDLFQTPTGTGNYDSFLRIQNDQSTTESGFNTGGDASTVLDDKAGQFTHSIQVQDLQIVHDDTTDTDYYVLRLDINEPGGNKSGLDLTAFQLYTSTSSTITSLATLTTTHLVYDMDGSSNGDITLKLNDNNAGSGQGDLQVLIPVDLFSGTLGTDFLYLYTAFASNNGGFEEWGAITTTPVTPPPNEKHAELSILKDTLCVDKDDTGQVVTTHSIEGGIVKSGADIAWVYTLHATGDIGASIYDVVLQDDKLGTLYNKGVYDSNVVAFTGDNGNGILELGETWTFTVNSHAVAGDYANTGTGFGVDDAGTTDTGDDIPRGPVTDLSDYFGVDQHITADKKTNGVDHLLNLFVGQSVTWSVDITKGASNVDLANVNIVDDQGVIYTLVSGDDGDSILETGETWHFTATGSAISGGYANKVTVTADTVIYDDSVLGYTTYTQDACDNSLQATASDTSDYTGHALATPGLTKGFWSTHLTLWDVGTGDEKGGTEVNVTPAKDWDFDTKIGLADLSGYVTKGPASGLGTVSGNNNGGGDSGLLLNDLNHNGLADDGCNLFFDLASAQTMANTSASGDARLILASQAIAAQLNEYVDFINDGSALTGTASPKGLLLDAARWLKGDTTYALSANGHSNVNGNTTNDKFGVEIINDSSGSDYSINGGALTLAKTPVMSSSDASWSTKVFSGFTYVSNVDGKNYDVWADGEGLKNALAAYNHGLDGTTAGFAVSTDGTLLGWQNANGTITETPYANGDQAFWGVLEDQNLLGALQPDHVQIIGVSAVLHV